VLLFVVPVAVADETLRPSVPRTIAVIPARYESSRFPGKPLAEIAGRPMIEHVYRRAAASRRVAAVLVATDDGRIADAVRAFGGEVRMTRETHRSGTERLAEVAASLDCDLVVNVQGDEPLVVPEMIDEAIAPLAADAGLPMGTLRRAIDDPAELASPHVVKVVVDGANRALYFSRAPIPARRDPGGPARAYKHIGLYVYRREFLITLAALPPTPLERTEMLEQLRALEHGYRVATVETRYDTIGVDTLDDLERVRALVERGGVAAAAP
jgi:3-deoxy-manno-octulosonate cytidylyltransferase (CMP-KDO synthetase)